jgi:hypothetical protein
MSHLASHLTAVTAVTPARRTNRGARTAGMALAGMTSAGLTGVFVGIAAGSVSGNRMAPWIIGRAAGVSAYLLLVVLVLLGLVLSHPWRNRLRRPSSAARIRLHIVLAVLTLAVTVLHVVVLATDRYAGVGWPGALLPLRASYRPVPVTLGVIGAWAGLLAGITAALAGHLPARAWWPIHKVAVGALVLVWLHGVLAGGDTHALQWMYLGTALLVLVVAISRYAARTPADRASELRR